MSTDTKNDFSLLIIIFAALLSTAVAGTIQSEICDLVRETTQSGAAEAFHPADMDSKVTGYKI